MLPIFNKMSNLAQLRSLCKRRNITENKLYAIETFLEQFNENDNIFEIKNRIREMPKIRKEFEDINLKIVTFGDEEDNDINPEQGTSQTELSAMVNFEKRWYSILSRLQLLEAEAEKTLTFAQSENVVNDDISLTKFNVRLPVINLPEFGGAYKEWLPFYDAFNNLIHENKSLDECQKFHYLKSCLKGEAYRAIDSLTISNANYLSAWTILQKRYKNTRLIVQSHVQAILNCNEMNKCNAENLRKLIDDVITNLEALRVLQIPVDSWDAILVTLIMSKLDYNTRKEFENTLDTETPSRCQLIDFLEKKCIILESMNQNIKQTKNQTSPNIKRLAHVTNRSAYQPNKISCLYCKQKHFISQCHQYLSLSVPERIDHVKKYNLCSNCLRNNHNISECKSPGCKKCNSREHHTLLHKMEETAASNVSNNPENSNVSVNHCSRQQNLNVVLSTAIVLIKDSIGNYQKCRTLLDVGSQINLLSETMCKKLNLKANQTKMSVWGINQTCSRVTKTVEITFASLFASYKNHINCCVVRQVTADIPVNSFDISHLNIPNDKHLADPNFNLSGQIDLLLGAQTFWDLLLDTPRIKLSNPNLYLAETMLGWIVGGASNIPSKSINNVCNIITKNNEDDINNLMEKFWVQETINTPCNKWSKEEIECDAHFVKTFRRDSDGRFIIRLPFKNNEINLGNSSKNALRRFFLLEKRFRSNPEFKVCYVNAINELLHLGFLEEVPLYESLPNIHFYLPHSGVISRNKKIRIVYDGSAKSSNGLSLNDNLMTGPNLQNDLFNILTRFRIHQVVISSDIEKMFLQIKVGENDQNFQQLYWRDSEQQSLKTYRLNRVVFGLTNSPYVAMRCVRQLALESEHKYPDASFILQNEIFMDDILCGAENIDKAIMLRNHLIQILNKGCFKLSKWISNDIRVLPNFNQAMQPKMLNLEKSKDSNTKVLGLWWDPSDDSLSFRIETPIIPQLLTKRVILSSIAKLFDPIGIISPIIVKAKIIMQELWTLNINWDEAVPQNIRKAWEKYVSELNDLIILKIPRKIVPEPNLDVDLITFSDASLRAYGASIYLRTQDKHKKFCTHLVCSKSRVSPVKVISLPRLELCAALLAAQLMAKVSNALHIKINKKYYFTDSEIVLHYIKSNANSWQTFVANRVSQIQSLCDVNDWRYIQTKENPADIISRGAYPNQIISSALYWHGPKFLSEEESLWPKSKFTLFLNENDIPEKRKVTLQLSVRSEFSLLTKYSSFIKLQHVIAYCLRFLHNLKNKHNRYEGFLSNIELIESHNVIMRLVQHGDFLAEYKALKKGQLISKSSKLYSLDPFIDETQIIRLGGRLRHSSLDFDVKHPIVLPAKHHVVKLLIEREHIKLLHAGATQTLASLRTKYWPLRAKDEVRKVIHSCYPCFRVSPRLITQKMGNLPKDRLEPCRPFLKVGLDYFGPIYLKQNKRSKIKIKAWVALFVCLVTKAVHLEVVSDLTSECFINALKRFIARRGKVALIYCDNATTFVGAKRELDEIYEFIKNENTQTNINSYLSKENISWKFIPPRAPNFGGLWERLVRSAKQHMKKITMNACLTFEEAVTLFSEIESIINSRPLSPLSNNPSDLQLLTPAHFLIGESLTSILEYDVTHLPENRLNNWQKISQIKQHFWDRWKKEVLLQLQPRSKWCQPVLNGLEPGTLVLLSEDTPPLVWKVGRIVELFPGSDGIPRVATIRTSHGIFKRPVRSLAILPINREVRE